MVFIRLIVKVYPREQLSRPYPTSNRKPPTTSSEHETKPASFLLALPNPEETSLGELARLIRSKWAKLRPNAEPLDIKKLLDDSRDTVDLDVDMTVADVWVNQARAKRDEDDQVGTVRVVQRPAPYAPVRFPSVDQDWGMTKEEKFRGKFETIEEAGETDTDSESGSEEESEEEEEESEVDKGNLIDAQARAVNGKDNEESETDESEEEESGEESEGGSEEDDNGQVNGRANAEESADEGESEEESAPDNDVRMEDSLPETRVLKRKMSLEELEPKKQPRLAQSGQASAANAENVNGTPVSSPLGTRKHDADRAPSFSGLGRRLSFTERPALSHGLGLGITKSPPRKKPFLMADLLKDSTQSESGPSDTRVSPTSVPPSSAPAIRRSSGSQHPSTPAKLQTPADKVRLLQSALRKDSPAERSPERRSVSFAEGEDHAAPTSVPVTRAPSRVISKEQKNGTNSGSKRAPPEPEEQSDEGEDQSEDEEGEFSKGINTEINEYERELQTNDLDEKSEYTRKLKLAAKKWQVMKNNEHKPWKREQERHRNAYNELKVLHQDIVELKEFNKPPSQRRKSQIPNGTPATKKLSRDPTSSQNRKSQDPWDVEILTPRADSKKLIPKNLSSSQTSRKSSEREEAQAQQQKKGHRSVEIPMPEAGSSAERRPESKKPSQERPPSPPSESESELESETSGSEEESTPKQPERKKPSSQEKPPSPPAGSESEDESGSEEEEEEEDNVAPNQPDSLTKPTSTVEEAIPDPVPEPGSGSDSEQQSGSDEEDEDEDEEKQGEEEEKDRSTDEESQNEDANQHEEKEKEMVQEPETQDDIVPETEEEREQETTTTTITPAQPNPPPTETPSKPNPAEEETESDADEESDEEEEEEEESDNESDKENRSLPKPASTAKANILRRTSLNPPSSQPNPPSSQQQQTSSQSTPTGSRPTRNTLKSLLFQQRAEQAQARLKKEEEAAKRKSQPRKDIFSGPSDSESEDEDESSSSSSSESESESGADAGDILSSGTVGRLRTAIPRK
ncbi:hypothetical protein BDV41DRAFT_328796 [Aspergillus transmontanensis]|uniref:Nucleolar protein Dnt1-like N-terminal domain-containing protein n=1 Tax=Aspergillus transmontanensis TaxID=1034304 RepID=A0A5N6WD13_9EURO|nr:hypothetical protein BDV41DRAFT_328796 [Aspergillus transmontanensis]